MARRPQIWIAAAAGAAAAGACAPDELAARDEAAAPRDARCSLTVSFGSYAMGIDRPAAAEVERIVGADPAVISVTREGAGREGEYALCVETRSGTGAQRLFERVRAALPADPRGPITLRSGKKSYAVPRR